MLNWGCKFGILAHGQGRPARAALYQHFTLCAGFLAYFFEADINVTGQDCVATFAVPCPGGKGFNPAAFVPPSGTAQGALGRNVLRGFSFFQLDTTVPRQFNLTERLNLQFRADFFNILNHPNFASPDPTLSDSTFGRSISTFGQGLGGGGADGGFNPLYQSGGARSIQMSLKLHSNIRQLVFH